MARDEVREITEDRWDDDVWGVAESLPVKSRARIVLYFGEKDHWVADHVRNDLMAKRASRSNELEMKTVSMSIDEMKVPHSFCICEYINKTRVKAQLTS